MFPEKFYEHVITTPLLPYQGPHPSWKEIWLKDETKQVTHSFKFRGNMLRLLELPAGTAVVAASTGNHALGMATAARILQLQAQVFVPATISLQKAQSIAALGAKVVMVDGDFDTCVREANAHAIAASIPYISGFDDALIIRGHASLFYECQQQHPQDFDAVFVPIGGGGLLAAALQYYQGTHTRVIGVELASVPSMKMSLETGQRVTVPPVKARTEGLLVRTAGKLPLHIAQQVKDLEIVLVSDDEVEHTIRLLWEQNDIRAEGAGAAALTAALRYRPAHPNQRTLAVVSGGNIDEQHFQDALDRK